MEKDFCIILKFCLHTVRAVEDHLDEARYYVEVKKLVAIFSEK